MAYIHPDLALFLAAIFVLGVFIRLFRETEVEVRGFGWIFLGISLFLVASFFNWFEETPLGYLMLAVTDEEGWDFIVPVFGYAPGGLMFCVGFAEWLRMAFILKKEVEQREIAEAELKSALASAGRANEAKNKFLSTMSHELRTPLAAIVGFSEIMSDPRHRKMATDDYIEYSKIILQSGKHLEKTIDDILTLTQQDADDYQLDEEAFDISAIAGECVYILAGEAEKKDIKVKKTLDVNLNVLADKRLVKQILLNILSNAVKFSGEGSIIDVTLKKDDIRGIILSVQDEGIGMTPTDAKKALEPFTQFEDTLTRKSNGPGLGLPLAKKFIEMHGGLLEITSQQYKGTKIDIVLPPERIQSTP